MVSIMPNEITNLPKVITSNGTDISPILKEMIDDCSSKVPINK